jgi:hypothetical protein
MSAQVRIDTGAEHSVLGRLRGARPRDATVAARD